VGDADAETGVAIGVSFTHWLQVVIRRGSVSGAVERGAV
jgi:hypothetical protein